MRSTAQPLFWAKEMLMTRIAGPTDSANRITRRPPELEMYERDGVILTIRLLTLVLLVLALFALTACGGGYGNSGDQQPVQAPQTAAAQFVDAPVVGLGVTADGLQDGQTDGTGQFNFAVGRSVKFFIGKGSDRAVIGTASLAPGAAGAAAPFSFHDLTEVQNYGDQYLGNLLSLLAALDANGDITDGIAIDAAAQAAVASAVAGGKTIDFNQSPDAFAKDPVVVAVVTALGRSLIGAEQALAQFSAFFPQSRSSSIALTRDDAWAVVVNRQKSTVSV